MNNFVQTGDTLTLTAPYTVASGAGAKIGSFFGIAANDYASGATDGEFATCGVHDIAKTSALAITQGDLLYWSDSSKVLTKTTTDYGPVAIAVADAADPSATVRAKLIYGLSALVDQSVGLYKRVALTNTQTKALNTAPTEIIAAPGAGKMIVIDKVTLYNDYGGAAFANGGVIQLSYGAGVTTPASATVAATFLTSPTADQVIVLAGALATNLASAAVNVAVNVACASADFITGTGILVVHANYRVISVP